MIGLAGRKTMALINLVLALIYLLTGKLGLALAFLQPNATAVWPPTGIALAANLLLGYGVWPGILFGAFLVNYATAGTAPTSFAIAVGNTIEGALGAYLVNSFANGPAAFERPHDVLKFSLLAALLSTMVSATIGVATLSLAGFVDGGIIPWTWLTWWLGDVTGALIVAPLLVVWSRKWKFLWRPHRALEAGAWVVALIFVGQAVFAGGYPFGAHDYPLEFLSIPLLIWAAFRFGQRATITAVFLLSMIALLGTLAGVGSFARASQNESLLLLQGFMATISVSSMALAAAVGDISHLMRELRQRVDEIQQSRRFLSAREDGLRKSIAEMLHGRVQSRLLVAWHGLGEALALQEGASESHKLIEKARDEIHQVQEEDVRQASYMLHPSIIAVGIVPAIRSLASRFEAQIRVAIEVDPRVAEIDDTSRDGLPEPVRLALYRAAEEALNNVCAHAHASEVEISLGLAEGRVRLSVRDNGRGFDRNRLREGLGLRAIASRVEELGGTWEILGSPGQGTTLSASLPLRI